MSDLEITKACAMAMGYGEFEWKTPGILTGSNIPISLPSGAIQYDPLTNDAQAMALLKRFPVTCVDALDNLVQWGPHTDADRQGLDMNRAICECVAKLRTPA
jgi:hypothetical protein